MICKCRECQRISRSLSPRVDDVWKPANASLGHVSEVPNRPKEYAVDVWDFTLTYRGRTSTVKIVREPDTSLAWVEDALGRAYERWRKAVDDAISKDPRPMPTKEQKDEIGDILRDIQHHRERRGNMTNLYHPVAKAN